MRTHGYLIAHNLNIACLGDGVTTVGVCAHFDRRLNKFPNDTVFEKDERTGRLLDGYIVNKAELESQNDEHNWTSYLSKISIDEMISLLPKMRGAFGGYIYDSESEELLIYTDQISNKTVYYFVDEDKWIISDSVKYMISVLKANDIPISFNEKSAEYMLTYGYMLDDSTYVSGIRRLLPGQYLIYRKYDGSYSSNIVKYHTISNEIVECTMDEAIDKLDAAFREAVRREFEKDREYGYKHLVDLSGGLDSRMVVWVAHEMGYTNQLNSCYCKAGYMDEKISRKIANYLGHEYFFKSLDDAEWLYDIDILCDLNNGASLYNGITGGERVLRMLDTDSFGIEHTGMIGDSIIGTFYHDEETNYAKPQMGMNRYSDYLTIELDDSATADYPTQEMFVLYTRGILSAQSTFILRQNYVETGSVFEDVDFMEVMYSIPFSLRNNHELYLAWINKCYPEAAKFGWEKWGGIRPKKSHIPLRMMKTALRLAGRGIRTAMGKPVLDTMNPMDYWYEQDEKIQKYFEQYFDDVIGSEFISDSIRKSMTDMFKEGNVDDKAMVLTVLATIKNLRD